MGNLAPVADEKRKWPSGVWHMEPDEKRWTDSASGYECLAARGPHGAWCGYVGITEGHPAFGKHYYKYEFTVEEVLSGSATQDAPIQAKINEIRVHGGLTFCGNDDLRGRDRYWFGFDCSHAGDFSPSYQNIDMLGAPTGWGGVIEYRDLQYVMEQCTELASQLKAIAVAT